MRLGVGRGVGEGLGGRQARLGGAGAVADHELVALLRDLHGLRDALITQLEAGAASGELQRLDRPPELQQPLKLVEEPTGQRRGPWTG